MTDSNYVDPEEAYYSQNRVLRVLGLVLGLCLACVIGVCLGAGLIYGLSRDGGPLAPAQAAMPFSGITAHDLVEKEIQEEIEKGLGARTTSGGAIITEVIPDSPADDAGLQVGDFVVAVDGVGVGAGGGLAAAVAAYEPGDRVEFEIERPGEGRQSVWVTLGSHPERDDVAYLGVGYSDLSQGGHQRPEQIPFGDLDEFELDDFHLDEFDLDKMPFALPEGGAFQGALVVQVVDDSPAAVAGVQEGDVITAFDGEAMEGPEALSAAVAAREPGERVVLTILRMRDGQEQEIPVTLAEHPDEAGRGYLGVSISGFLRMEQFGDPSSPGQFRFYHQGPGPELDWEDMPFNWDEMPFDPESFDWEGMPFDPENFNWDGMPIDPDNLPFDLDELPFDPEDFERHREFDDQST